MPTKRSIVAGCFCINRANVNWVTTSSTAPAEFPFPARYMARTENTFAKVRFDAGLGNTAEVTGQTMGPVRDID